MISDENQKDENRELVDKIADKVVWLLSTNPPAKRARKSQILSALIGAVGFALFVDGVVKLSTDIPAWISLLAGIILMAATGLLLHNLNR